MVPVIKPTDEMLVAWRDAMKAAAAEAVKAGEPLERSQEVARAGLAAALLIAVRPYVNLLADLVDSDECWFDHHGYCQAHAWFATEPVCPHARAKKLLAEESC